MWISKKTSEELLKTASPMNSFKKFMPTSTPITRTRRYLNRLERKYMDIKFAFRIIFKGEYPEDF